ncbi:MAG: class II fructose-bisphosphate aldolase [Patescibacteria group bacterium]|nr:class II fructose-bisphosphate aldolase [Patescibacteria group bacterium]MBU1870713.1 class II fructose-bisphosphate aldolase [Patescibacteria group bacterium]
MLVHIKNIVKKAQQNGYAVGAFNIINLESILGVAQAAVKTKSPIIMQVSESAIKYMGLKPVVHLVSTVAKNVGALVPVALHLDHGGDLDIVYECINAGFTSIHIDASNLPFDENVNLTKQVVKFARPKNVWIQGEIGSIVGGHGEIGKTLKEIPQAKLEDVVKFVQQTKVDTIAAAIGTAHGVYENEDINFHLLKNIKTMTKKVFVLHGGSGISNQKIKKAIKLGVNIINIGSDIKIAFCQTLISVCAKNKKEMDPRNLLKPTIKAVELVVIDKIKLFGSANQVTFKNLDSWK